MFGGAADMATFFYGQHYREKIAPNLSIEQKQAIVKRISDLTLYEPFQLAGKDYADRFPELKPYINASLSGLYLVTIMEGMMNDLGFKLPSPSLAYPFGRAGRRHPEVRVRTHARRAK